ncbi:dihydroneopterin aldolase [Candidatus Amarolinea aalborgensis]|jgi:FolB domain-containing protein|uniref:dihydroneopterin aldolase n=1 Tax=Candidatus Amarolinea aalborgensis TaxID=2249329 RepID=UPI003BF95D3E
MKLDRVEVRDLLLRCIIGINPEERVNPQDVLINLTLFADISRAGHSDDIADAINYKTATKRVIALVEQSKFFLVEKMATEIAHLILSEFDVERIVVRLEKPGALRFARSVGVEIERTRADFDLPPLSAHA